MSTDSSTASPATDRKTIALVISTMRSGSTLLKALLAEGEDVSNLPEVNFQKFAGNLAYEEISKLDSRRIIVLKRPAWYQELSSYPRMPDVDGLKSVLLVRDVYETVLSLRKMTFGRAHQTIGPLLNRFLVKQYWSRITSTIARLDKELGDAGHLIRYEHLVREPIDRTKELFEFLGSKRSDGTKSYSPPENFKWKWGRDDGSDNIKSLEVQAPRDHGYKDRKLLELIKSSPTVCDLRRSLGYPDLP